MKTSLKQERAKLSEMGFKEKIQYIWEYYKIHLVGVVAAVFIIGSFINAWFVNPPAGIYLYIAWQGRPVSFESLADIESRLADIVPPGENQRVRVSSYVLTPGDPEMMMGMQTRLAGVIAMGELDLFIMDREVLYNNAAAVLLRPATDITAYLAEADFALHSDIGGRLVEITFMPENGFAYVTDMMAISLYGSPLLTAAGVRTDGLYLGMVGNSDRFYEVSKALRVIFG